MAITVCDIEKRNREVERLKWMDIPVCDAGKRSREVERFKWVDIPVCGVEKRNRDDKYGSVIERNGRGFKKSTTNKVKFV